MPNERKKRALHYFWLPSEANYEWIPKVCVLYISILYLWCPILWSTYSHNWPPKLWTAYRPVYSVNLLCNVMYYITSLHMLQWIMFEGNECLQTNPVIPWSMVYSTELMNLILARSHHERMPRPTLTMSSADCNSNIDPSYYYLSNEFSAMFVSLVQRYQVVYW